MSVLLEEGQLQPVGWASKESFRRKNKGSKVFLDDTNALYKFVSRGLF